MYPQDRAGQSTAGEQGLSRHIWCRGWLCFSNVCLSYCAELQTSAPQLRSALLPKLLLSVISTWTWDSLWAKSTPPLR